ncbi:ArsR/SmtB family transcription factor [Bordetella trematum]|uniref:ArsR/SmtB family transcription factor n=1 Tax=Bordetella trematum TaxID=123899 RepID=UPI0015C52F46|nr:metalloregulator ArsR/SmtB family transcription factor [Bordetella trematum]
MNAHTYIDGSGRLDPLAEVAKALGHPHRLALLELIVREERSVETLAVLTGISVANASQHLQHLKRAGCVQTRREGKQIFYLLGDGPLAAVVASLHDYAKFQRDRIRSVLTESRKKPQAMESVSIQALLARMDSGSVVLLDVRSDGEYARRHLPGAISIPLAQLADRAGELSNTTEIVAYCDGRYCVLSSKAADILRKRGLKASQLEGGVDEWQAAGLAVDTTL